MKKAKTKARRRINKKLLAIVAGVALLISIQGFINYKLWLWGFSEDTTTIRSLVIEANDNLYKNAPVDARTGDIYISEARLMMPAVTTFTPLRYSYHPASPADKQDEEIYLSASGRLASKTKLYAGTSGTPTMAEFFEQIPQFQACSRQFLVKFNKTNSSISTNYSYIQSLTLADGRTAYLYENEDCTTEDNTFATLYFANLQSY